MTGAGPGDPGLMTLRALEVLRQADLVLYDGLVNPLLLRQTDAICERTARTRVDDRAIVAQEEVNRRLIAAAQAGKCVVRLKGGDPFIFGRGSEEAAALEAAGIPYEVIPGITAATAAAEYSGFSYTHRSHTSAVAFVTGHEDPTKPESRLDYGALANFPGTLVFYMGLGRLSQICDELIQHGMPENTPAAVVCKASLPAQRVVQGHLTNLPDVARSAGLKPPSLIVVGECVNLRQADSWFEKRPLFGQNIAVTCADHQADSVVHQIVVRSGQPLLMPLLQISPADDQQARQIQQCCDHLEDFDWLVFTSGNGVTEFFHHLNAAGKDSRALGHLKIATVGPSTAAQLKDYGVFADIIPETYRAEALADSLRSLVVGKTVLWARADRGRDVLAEQLLAAGAKSVKSLIVYRNSDQDVISESAFSLMKQKQLHWICLSSPAAARRLATSMQSANIDLAASNTRLAAISPLTARACEEIGLAVNAVAEDHTWPGMLDAIEAVCAL